MPTRKELISSGAEVAPLTREEYILEGREIKPLTVKEIVLQRLVAPATQTELPPGTGVVPPIIQQ